MFLTPRRIGGCVAVVALLATAGCGSQVQVDAARVGVSTRVTSTTTPRVTARSVTPGASQTSPPSSSVAPCLGPSLAASLVSSDGAAGHMHLVLGLRNTGTQACTVNGYPQVQLRAPGGQAVPVTVTHDGDPAFPAATPAPVSIAPGESGSFDLGYSHVPVDNETCPQASTVMVLVPGDTAALPVSVALDPCDHGHLAISPVAAGTAGSAG